MQLVGQIHVVDARLHVNTIPMQADAAFEVVRLLRAQIEISHRQHRRHADALVDIGHTETLRHAREHRKISVESVLDP